jgi:hypothetical protein
VADPYADRARSRVRASAQVRYGLLAALRCSQISSDSLTEVPREVPRRIGPRRDKLTLPAWTVIVDWPAEATGTAQREPAAADGHTRHGQGRHRREPHCAGAGSRREVCVPRRNGASQPLATRNPLRGRVLTQLRFRVRRALFRNPWIRPIAFRMQGSHVADPAHLPQGIQDLH